MLALTVISGGLTSLIVAIVVLGLLYWLITLLPIPNPFKQVVLVIFVLILILVVLSSFGFIGTIGSIVPMALVG